MNKYEKALEAIKAVFNNMANSPQETLEDLQALREEIEDYINVIETE
jgi:hypothetical protein